MTLADHLALIRAGAAPIVAAVRAVERREAGVPGDRAVWLQMIGAVKELQRARPRGAA